MQRRLFAGATFLLATATLLGLGLFGSPSASGQSSARVWLDPRSERIDYTDGSFTLDVKLADLDHQGTIGYDTNRDGTPDRFEDSNGLGAYELTLHFDPNVVVVADMQAGDFLRSSGRSTQCLQRNSNPGEFVVGCVSFGGTDGPQGSGSLATLTIEPVANGMSFLALDAGLGGPLGDSIEVTIGGGVLEVYNGPNKPPPAQTGGPGGSPGPTTAPGTPLPPAAATATAASIATSAAIATSVQETATALGTPPDDGTPSPTTSATPDPGGSTGDDSGSGAMPWVIGISVAAVVAIMLLVASRFVIRARRA